MEAFFIIQTLVKTSFGNLRNCLCWRLCKIWTLNPLKHRSGSFWNDITLQRLRECDPLAAFLFASVPFLLVRKRVEIKSGKRDEIASSAKKNHDSLIRYDVLENPWPRGSCQVNYFVRASLREMNILNVKCASFVCSWPICDESLGIFLLSRDLHIR